METKEFKIRFYVGQVGADGNAGRVSDALSQMISEGAPVVRRGLVSYEIRELKAFNNSSSFAGIFARFRSDHLPNIGTPGGAERDIEISQEEGLLEKNHFLYYRANELLVYQHNGNGSRPSRLAEYFGEFLNATTVLAPVLQPDATKRLLQADVKPLSLELNFAKPTDAEWYPSEEWTRELFQLMREGNVSSIRLGLKGSGRGKTRKPLAQKIKKIAMDLVKNVDVTVARMDVLEEDGIHPIDLIAESLSYTATVEMDGRYPVAASMYRGLQQAKDEHLAALSKIFGTGKNVLD